MLDLCDTSGASGFDAPRTCRFAIESGAIRLKNAPMKSALASVCLMFLFTANVAGLDQEQLNAHWEWIRESPSEWSLENGVLRFRTQPDRIWAGSGSRNLLVARKPFPEKAAAVADVELVEAINEFEQCGLLVYEHDDAFVKLILEHIDGLHYVVMAWEGKGEGKVIAKIEVPASRVELKYEVDGSQVTGFWRLPGKTDWNKAAECASPTSNPPRFALFTQDGPREEKRWALVRKLEWEAGLR
jgi:hypothetical protein